MFRLEIETGNDAFNPDPAPELARILRRLADRLEQRVDAGGAKVLDINGTTVGRWTLEHEPAEDDDDNDTR